MPTLAEQAHEQNMTQIAQIGAVAQANFVQVAKFADLRYLQGADMVSLPEALGAREVGSKTVPAGPNSVAQA